MVARLVIAAPCSGSGKTTVATGLIAALRRRGTSVAPFKVGPDYIDPGYHTLAAGRPGRNLDPVLVGEDRIPPLFAHGALGTDVAVIEGVMGLFDGRTGTASSGTRSAAGQPNTVGSTAHVARLLAAPVVLVVDARGQGRSLAALLHGFRDYDAGVRVAGVIVNKVGSEHHELLLREACAEVGLPVLGALRRDTGVELPSRHLGLVTAAEHGGAATRAIDAMAALVTEAVDLDAVLRLADAVPPLNTEPWSPEAEIGEPVAGGLLVAVAGGAAFTFGYAEHAELLAAAGAEVVVFDPLCDERLPEGTAGVVLPGGFPEQHASALSVNEPLRAAVAEFARSGGVVHAECGGLLYLARRLDDHPMCGVLSAEAIMTDRLTLGYRDAVAASQSPLHAEGARRTGHEFHRTVLRPGLGDRPAWIWRNHAGITIREGFVHGNLHASYLHTHPTGDPASVANFVRRCAA